MKVYRFYAKRSFVDSLGINTLMTLQEDFQGEYMMYALTNKKELAKRFMEDRDMDIFILRKGEMERSEYAEIANDIPYILLEETTLATRGENNKGEYVSIETNMVLTDGERLTVSYNGEEGMWLDIYSEEFWNRCIPLELLSDKSIKKALRYMEYDKFYKIMTQNEYAMMDDGSFEMSTPDDYAGPEVITDELGLFVKLFGSTLKQPD